MSLSFSLALSCDLVLPSSSGSEPNINLFPTAIQNGHINLIIRCVIGLADEPPTPSDGIKSGCPPFRRGIKLRRVMVMAHSDVGRRDASSTSPTKTFFVGAPGQVDAADVRLRPSRVCVVLFCQRHLVCRFSALS